MALHVIQRRTESEGVTIIIACRARGLHKASRIVTLRKMEGERFAATILTIGARTHFSSAGEPRLGENTEKLGPCQ
jgi:hypothetical protein